MAPRSSTPLPRGIRRFRGKFQVRYYDARGVRRSKLCESLSEAKAFQAEAKAERLRPPAVEAPSPPFDEFAQRWMSSRLRQSPRTRQRNVSIIEKHLVGDSRHGFGRAPIASIKQVDVQGWVNWMAARYSSNYVRTCFSLLSGIFKAAVIGDVLPKSPAIGIELPPERPRKEIFLSEEEVELLADCIDPFFRPVIVMAAGTGLRWEEIAGLRWSNVDLRNAEIQVQQVATYVSSGAMRDGGKEVLTYGLRHYPKSDSSRRTLGITPDVVEALLQRRHDGPEQELVFTTKAGRLINPSNFNSTYWKRAVAKFLERVPAHRAAELEGFTFHSLRHTHCSLLIRHGWTEPQIVGRMGWRDGRMLHRVYGHLFPRYDRELVADLHRKISEARGERHLGALEA